MPHEIVIGGIYLPPFLIAVFAGILLATVTVFQLNRVRWSRYFWHPQLVFIAITTIYTVLFGTLIIPM